MSTIVAQTLSNGTVSTSTANCISGSAKAWVNFGAANPPVINGSFNVSSITRINTGQYTVNFTTAMPNANYCATYNNSNGGRFTDFNTFTTTSLNVRCVSVSDVFADVALNCVAIFSS